MTLSEVQVLMRESFYFALEDRLNNRTRFENHTNITHKSVIFLAKFRQAALFHVPSIVFHFGFELEAVLSVVEKREHSKSITSMDKRY